MSVERSDLEKQLSEVVLPMFDELENNPENKKRSFDVVLGPSGSGKTALIRQVCARHPQGVLYYEVFNPNQFPKELGQAAGMILKPQNLFDLAISYVSDAYQQYHVIPENLSDGASYVMDAIAEQAKKV